MTREGGAMDDTEGWFEGTDEDTEDTAEDTDEDIEDTVEDTEETVEDTEDAIVGVANKLLVGDTVDATQWDTYTQWKHVKF